MGEQLLRQQSGERPLPPRREGRGGRVQMPGARNPSLGGAGGAPGAQISQATVEVDPAPWVSRNQHFSDDLRQVGSVWDGSEISPTKKGYLRYLLISPDISIQQQWNS